MKLRTDFVTNSSSSSFIIAYKENNFEDSVKKQVFDFCYEEGNTEEQRTFFINKILEDTMNNQCSFDELIEMAKEEFEHKAWYEFFKKCNRDLDKMESEEKDIFTEQFVNEKIEELKTLLKDKNAFAKISYSDNDGTLFSVLEHELVPNLIECIEIFSHH